MPYFISHSWPSLSRALLVMFSHSLITSVRNVIFIFPVPFSRVICVPLPCIIKCCAGHVSSPSWSFYPATEAPRSHTPFPAPHPLPYCSGPGRNPHSPVSQPPPPLYSYQPGAPRTERRKEKKKDLCLSVRDYRLPLSTDHVRLPCIGSCFHKGKKWKCLQGVESYKLKQMAVLHLGSNGDWWGRLLMFGVHRLVSAGQHVVFAV